MPKNVLQAVRPTAARRATSALVHLAKVLVTVIPLTVRVAELYAGAVIPVRRLFDLEVSAASGLVVDGGVAYVVADDETYLDGYDLGTGQRVARVPLLGGVLPEEHHARKAAKPDFECLTWLPGRRLLALGSGSSARRRRGVLLYVEGAPAVRGEVDAAPLYEHLARTFHDVNIEGAAVAGPVLRLLQRGGHGAGAARPNAVIDLDLAATLRCLDERTPWGPSLVRHVRTVTLGEVSGVALGFTDGCPLGPSSSSILFAAAAEDTDNPYDDGPCGGSVLGILDAEGHVSRLDRLEGDFKVEGITRAGGTRLLLVADADDRTRAAPLLEADWPPGDAAVAD